MEAGNKEDKEGVETGGLLEVEVELHDDNNNETATNDDVDKEADEPTAVELPINEEMHVEAAVEAAEGNKEGKDAVMDKPDDVADDGEEKIPVESDAVTMDETEENVETTNTEQQDMDEESRPQSPMNEDAEDIEKELEMISKAANSIQVDSADANTHPHDTETLQDGNDLKPYKVVTSIKIATNQDTYDSLRLDGYVLIDMEYSSKDIVHEEISKQVKIMLKWVSYDEVYYGVEDVLFHAIGDDAEEEKHREDGYTLLTDFDFSTDNERPVYLSVKYTDFPRCVGVYLLKPSSIINHDQSSTEEGPSDMDTLLKPYTETHYHTIDLFDRNRIDIECSGTYHHPPADTILDNAVEFTQSYILLLKFSQELEEETLRLKKETELAGNDVSKEQLDVSRVRSGANLEEEDELSVFTIENEEDVFESIEDLNAKINRLSNEHTEMVKTNAELQRTCVALLLKEKQMVQQTLAAASTTEDKHNVDKETGGAAAGGGGGGGGVSGVVDAEASAENDAEKKRHFEENLELINASRARLQRQKKEAEVVANDLQTRLDDKKVKSEELNKAFKSFKREIMMKAHESRTGKSIPLPAINAKEKESSDKELTLEEVRLRNIGLRIALFKLEKARKSREQLAEGLHMIDFEQLKIENQTLNEKIEERNEELSKLKRKKITMVQVLTHAREKLRFIEKQNEDTKRELDKIESLIAKERLQTNNFKTERDTTREECAELVRKQGFGTSDMLVHDFEKRKADMIAMKFEITEYEARYKGLTMQLDRKKALLDRHLSSQQDSSALRLPPIRYVDRSRLIKRL